MLGQEGKRSCAVIETLIVNTISERLRLIDRDRVAIRTRYHHHHHPAPVVKTACRYRYLPMLSSDRQRHRNPRRPREQTFGPDILKFHLSNVKLKQHRDFHSFIFIISLLRCPALFAVRSLLTFLNPSPKVQCNIAPSGRKPVLAGIVPRCAVRCSLFTIEVFFLLLVFQNCTESSISLLEKDWLEF